MRAVLAISALASFYALAACGDAVPSTMVQTDSMGADTLEPADTTVVDTVTADTVEPADTMPQADTSVPPAPSFFVVEVFAQAPAQAHLYYDSPPPSGVSGYTHDEMGPTPYRKEVPRDQACVWGVEVDLRVALSENPSMPWYNNPGTPSFDTVTIKVDGTTIDNTVIQHSWEGGGNIALTRELLGCP